MTTAQILIEVGKMIFPVLTVGLAAYLAARYYKKNKRVDFSLKLSEKVLEEVYSPILSMFEMKSNESQSYVYEGITYAEILEIEKIIQKHRHLVSPLLISILRDLKLEIQKESKVKVDGMYINIKVDKDKRFLEALQNLGDFHLKRIGFFGKT